MNIIVDKKISQAAFSRIRCGNITKINSNNTVNLTMDGRNYTNVQYMAHVTPAVGNLVFICFPDNKTSNMVILGKL